MLLERSTPHTDFLKKVIDNKKFLFVDSITYNYHRDLVFCDIIFVDCTDKEAVPRWEIIKIGNYQYKEKKYLDISSKNTDSILARLKEMNLDKDEFIREVYEYAKEI